MPPPLFAEVRAIYFDLDDTLCGYWKAAGTGLRNTFSALSQDLGSPEKMVEHWATEFRAYCTTLKQTGWYENYLKFGEPSRTELMRLTLLRLGLDDPVRARQLSDRYAHERDKALALFEETEEVLELLKPRFQLGLITNGPADVQRQEFTTLQLDRFIEHVFIEGEMGRGKPLIEVFHQAQAAVGLDPHQILFVGNSYGHDIAPGINAGWRTAWIRRPTDVPPSTAAEEARPESLPIGAAEPDITINSLREVLPHLNLS